MTPYDKGIFLFSPRIRSSTFPLSHHQWETVSLLLQPIHPQLVSITARKHLTRTYDHLILFSGRSRREHRSMLPPHRDNLETVVHLNLS